MATKNNPAGRLFHLLHEAKNCGGISAIQAFQKVLEVPEDDYETFYKRIGLFFDLPNQISEQVEAIPNQNHSLLLRGIPKIKQAIKTINLNQNVQTFLGPFDGEFFYNLEICSDLLSKHSPEKTIKSDTLKGIQKEIEEIIEETLASDLNQTLKRFIMKHLQLILIGIQEYIISGATNIEQALKTTLGSIITNQNEYKTSNETAPGKKLWGMVGKIALLTSIVGSTLQIGETTVDIIKPSGGPCEIITISEPICESFEYQQELSNTSAQKT